MITDNGRWRVLAPALVLVSGACWGMTGFFSHYLFAAGLSPAQQTMIRCVVATVLLFAATAVKDRSLLRIDPRDIWIFIGSGVCSFAMMNLCYFTCIVKSTLSIACILLYTGPCFAMLMSCIFFHEKFTARKAMSAVLAFLGCVFITGVIGVGGGARISAAAALSGLGSGFAYSLYTIFSRVAVKKYSSLTATAYTFLFASLALLPFCRASELARGVSSGPFVAFCALMIGLLCTQVPYLLYVTALEHMETGKAALLTFTEPMVATVVSAVVFREAFAANNAIGIMLIIASIVMIQYRSGN